MSDGGGSVDDYDIQDREQDINSDNLSNQQSDSPTQQDPQDEVQQNQDDEQKDENQESEQYYHKSAVIQQPLFTQSNTIKITPPFLTKYQKARVIGVRAMQISKNSPLYLNADDKDLTHWDPLFIAEKELAEEKIPFIIRRYLPDSSYEDWKLADLKSLD